MTLARTVTRLAAGVILLGAAPLAQAGCCPNACSGHGTCTVEDACICYSNWHNGEAMDEAGDCADRSCPYELAWADAPGGTGLHHNYAECANKGTCNRVTGMCECFEGYTGKACQRMTCPNDCSGHGRCVTASEAYYGVNAGSYSDPDNNGTALLGSTNGNDAATFTYTGWDKDMTRLCTCDPGFEGVDCSLRGCPNGNDVMVERLNRAVAIKYQKQEICMYFGSSFNDFVADVTQDVSHMGPLSMDTSSELETTSATVTATVVDSSSTTVTFAVDAYLTFALSFTTANRARFTTVPINLYLGSGHDALLAQYVEAALEGLPAGVIDDVTVTADYSAAAASFGYSGRTNCDVLITVEFSGDTVQGNQNLLEVEYQPCGAGCTPRITGVSLATQEGNPEMLSYVAQVQEADMQNWVCGGRGKCDYTSGQCQCFSGFYGLHCETQTALI